MPHEVIMPALGMAQETGLIVSWLKAPGDAVAAGDILFEVETDKSTMEVEAGADGFVTEIRFDAGSDVPVGNVIAVISDSADAIAAPEPAPVATGDASPAVEGHGVIMPALGMAQDSGLIVAWHKAPGDAVAADDILFEVETDKSTVEVEAGADGYIAALLAEAGEEAPVGDVIAVISAAKPDKPVQSSLKPNPPSAGPDPLPVPAIEPVTKQAPALAKQPVKPIQTTPGGRILASPKARRLALERGLDLSTLAARGIAQPYHAADLDQLPPAAGGHSVKQISARADRRGFASFAAWLETELEQGSARAFAAFAAASLRGQDRDQTFLIQANDPATGDTTCYVDPDLSPLSQLQPGDPAAPDLILYDMTGGPVTALALGADAAPALTIGADADAFHLTLTFTDMQLSTAAALALVEGVAARLNEPLTHLL